MKYKRGDVIILREDPFGVAYCCGKDKYVCNLQYFGPLCIKVYCITKDNYVKVKLPCGHLAIIFPIDVRKANETETILYG